MRYPFKAQASCRPRSGGFTLLELLAVLAILAFSTALVAVNFGRSTGKAILSDEAVRVRGTLAEARDLALTERIPSTFYVDENSGAYGIEGKGARQPHESITVSTEEKVVFFPKGNSTGGEVFIKSRDGRRMHVLVDPITGEARLKRL